MASIIDPRLEEFAPINLSKECIMSHAIKIKFDVDYMDYDIVTPKITDELLQEYYPNYVDDMPRDLDVHCAIALEEYAESVSDSFEQSDSFQEWKDGFEPHTNWFYHVPLADKNWNELQKIATNISDWSGNVTLLECKGNYYLTLNASGMDLRWDIAAAFIACGFVPPLEVLESLPAMATESKYRSTVDDTVSSLVLQSVLECVSFLNHKGDSLINSLETLTN